MPDLIAFPPVTLPSQPLFILRNANMQSVADQQMVKQGTFTNWAPAFVFGIWVSGGATIACAGGLYTAASKAGTAFVLATQSWITLTGSLLLVPAPIIALTSAFNTTPFLSLTTGSTAAVTANLFIYGYILD